MSWKEYFGMYLEKYDPDQARDEGGRWTAVGGGAGDAKSRESGERRVGKDLAPGVRVLKANQERLTAANKEGTKGIQIQDFVQDYALTHGVGLSERSANKALDSLDTLVKSGKVTIEKELLTYRDTKTKQVVEREVLTVVPTKAGLEDMKKYEGKVGVPTHGISPSKPIAYENDPKGIAQQALDIRRAEYPDTRHGTQGRYFSSSKDAPELTFDAAAQFTRFKDQEVAKLMKAGGVSKADAERKAEVIAHTKVKDHLRTARSRQEIFGHTGGPGTKGQIDFYDAVSSQNALIGVMTGNEQLMNETRLLGEKSALQKAYFNAFNPTSRGPAIPYNNPNAMRKELPFLKDKDDNTVKSIVKEMAKATFTAGGYGSGRGSEKASGAGGTVPATLAVMAKYGLKTKDNWDANAVNPKTGAKTGWFAPKTPEEQRNFDRAVSMAHQMRDNLDNHPSTVFTQGIREAVKVVSGTGFVFDNPVDGHKLPLDKHNTGRVKRTIGGRTVAAYVPKAKIDPDTRQRAEGKDGRIASVNRIKTAGASAAVFVQSMDKAALGIMMTQLKSPHTIHDSIGVVRAKGTDSKGALKTPGQVQRAVTKAYESIQKADVMGKLEKQMTEHMTQFAKKSKWDAKKRDAEILKIKAAFNKIKKIKTTKKTPQFHMNTHFENEPLDPYKGK